jgi:hypothetical protein
VLYFLVTIRIWYDGEGFGFEKRDKEIFGQLLFCSSLWGFRYQMLLLRRLLLKSVEFRRFFVAMHLVAEFRILVVCLRRACTGSSAI